MANEKYFMVNDGRGETFIQELDEKSLDDAVKYALRDAELEHGSLAFRQNRQKENYSVFEFPADSGVDEENFWDHLDGDVKYLCVDILKDGDLLVKDTQATCDACFDDSHTWFYDLKEKYEYHVNASNYQSLYNRLMKEVEEYHDAWTDPYYALPFDEYDAEDRVEELLSDWKEM